MFKDFYSQYFNQPAGYTIPETIIFGAILVVAIYLLYRFFLKKLEVEIDEEFLLSLVPFIVFGGILRSLGPGDGGVFKGYWFDTPGIYLLITLITVASLLASRFLDKRTQTSYLHWMWVLGSSLCVFNLYFVIQTGFENPAAFVMILGLVGVFAGALYPVVRFFPGYLSKLNYGILVSHLLDGSSAFVSVSYFGYAEKHVLPRFLFGILGPWVMFPLKLGVVWLVLFTIDRTVEEKSFRTWLKVAVLVLGLALGTRNLLTVSMGV